MNSRHSLKNLKGRPGAATAPPRRGNALVLAAGILVLLVIIATAYVSRTQAEREVSAATQRAETRDAVAGVIAEDIARQIADSLFVREVDADDPDDPNDTFDPQLYTTGVPPGGGIADANFPRRPLQSDAVRYSFDTQPLGPFPYNFAPYYVSPWTNWPDFATLDNIYPGDFATYVAPHGDRVGNPGFGDTRWLRDSEPMRLVIDDPTPELPNSGDELVVYTHFLHLSNIARAENGWRICSDISDIGDQYRETGVQDPDGFGLLVTELNFPVEQWLPMYWNETFGDYDYAPSSLVGALNPPSSGTLSSIRAGGNPSFITDDDLPPPQGSNLFLTRWARWFFPTDFEGTFGTPLGYPNQFRGLGFLGISDNFLNLRDLDGDGVVHDFDDRPEDEFNRGTARHTVSRVLTDTDGDGFTDSFWFLAPTSAVAGTRTIVGVSIIDNAGKANLNAASRGMMADVNLDQDNHDIDEGFNPQGVVPTGAPADFIPRDPHTATVGHTPADLTLVGYPFEAGSFGSSGTATLPAAWADQWNVGLFDNWIHQEANWLPGIDDTLAADDPDSPFGELNSTYWPGMWVLDATDSSDDSDPARRYNFLQQLGVVFASTGGPVQPSSFFPDLLRTQEDRRRYWLNAGRKPFDPGWELTPFTLADEIELRMFHGNNYPWVLSRFERSMQDHWDSSEGSQLFRGSVMREESNEYLDQLVNFELVRDLRGKSTFFSSTRNDLLPPWLWWEPHEISTDLPLPDRINDLIGAALSQAEVDAIRNTFFAQSRLKLDLRDGLSTAVEPAYWETFPRRGELSFHERLPYMLRLALYDYFGDDGYEASEDDTEQTAAALAANLEAYRSGPRVDAFGNVFRGDELQYPDAQHEQFIPIAAGGTGIAMPHERANRAVVVNPDAAQSDRMLGMERQPFILEVFIAHVYEPADLEDFDEWFLSFGPTTLPPQPFDNQDVVPADPNPVEEPNFNFPGAGQRYVDSSSDSTTIAVVQIVNPFTESDETDVDFDLQGIDLNDYAIRLFGQTLRIDSLILPDAQRFLKPATEEKPRTAIFHLITNESFGSDAGPLPDSMLFPGTPEYPMFKHRWMDFLDLPQVGGPTPTAPADSKLFVDPFDPNDGTIVIDVNPDASTTPTGYVNPWALLRSAYDNYAIGNPDRRAVELLKKVTYPDLRVEWVVVDRTGSVDASGSNENDELTRRAAELPQPPAASGPDTPPGQGWNDNFFNGVRLADSTGQSFDYWVPWVRMTRAWGYDFNFEQSADHEDLGIQAGERAPRCVFGREFVSKADNAPLIVPQGLTDESDMYRIDADPGPAFMLNDPDSPWFDKRHAAYGDVALPTLELRRKPFFFTMNPVYVADGLGPPPADPDLDPDDIYPPWFVPAPAAAQRSYGYYFWYVDVSNPLSPRFRPSPPDPPGMLSFQAPSAAAVGPWGAGVPSKGLLPDQASVLVTGAEPTTGSGWVPFRHFFPHSLQMNQKDGDFEQVGELFNLWLHGHELGPNFSSSDPILPSTNPAISEPPVSQNIWPTKVTFAERMGQLVGTDAGNPDDPGPRVNRLAFGPVIGDADPAQTDELNHAFPALPAGLRVLDAFVCDGPGRDAYITDYNNSGGGGTGTIDLTASALFDDGTVNDIADFAVAEDRAFRNAQGFAGAGTPGLLNLNTATVEALRSLPQGAAIVNELFRLNGLPPPNDVNEPSAFIRSDNYLADALMYYRDCLAALSPLLGDPPTQQWEPTYAAINPLLLSPTGDPLMEAMRSGYLPSGGAPAISTGIRNELGEMSETNPNGTVIADLEDLRGERGFASIGEIALAVNQPNATIDSYLAQAPPLPVGEVLYPYRWRMDMLGHPDVEMFDPFSGTAAWPQTPVDQPVSASLSVDTTKIFDSSVIVFSDPVDPDAPGQMVPDRTAKDNEELNMLMAGMSNLVSTRSDMFTVYLKVRTFRQDPATGRWDATKKENILDDSRYVMLVDRSNVNTPGDQPRILYFEKVAK